MGEVLGEVWESVGGGMERYEKVCWGVGEVRGEVWESGGRRDVAKCVEV